MIRRTNSFAGLTLRAEFGEATKDFVPPERYFFCEKFRAWSRCATRLLSAARGLRSRRARSICGSMRCPKKASRRFRLERINNNARPNARDLGEAFGPAELRSTSTNRRTPRRESRRNQNPPAPGPHHPETKKFRREVSFPVPLRRLHSRSNGFRGAAKSVRRHRSANHREDPSLPAPNPGP